MNLSNSKTRWITLFWMVCAWSATCLELSAFPPSPDHVIYGVVRDELGNPITLADTEILLTTADGTVLRGKVNPDLPNGLNYKLRIPLDSGLTADAYKPTALNPTVPFRLTVRAHETEYLPIEMTGRFHSLGRPAGETRVDLTLGEDTDRDGLPDAWERNIIQSQGGNLTLADIKPDGDTDKDGMTNQDEYLAGTYAFDSADGFSLQIAGMDNGHPLLEFTAVKGRNYTISGSANLKQWTPVVFTVPAEGEPAPKRLNYQAHDVRRLLIRADDLAAESPKFFRVSVR